MLAVDVSVSLSTLSVLVEAHNIKERIHDDSVMCSEKLAKYNANQSLLHTSGIAVSHTAMTGALFKLLAKQCMNIAAGFSALIVACIPLDAPHMLLPS